LFFFSIENVFVIRRRFHPFSCGHGLKTTLFENVTAENARKRYRAGTAEQGGHGPPLFRWIVEDYRIKSSLPAWNSSRAIMPPPPLLNSLRGPCRVHIV
jgi:hypothetical protein